MRTSHVGRFGHALGAVSAPPLWVAELVGVVDAEVDSLSKRRGALRVAAHAGHPRGRATNQVRGQLKSIDLLRR